MVSLRGYKGEEHFALGGREFKNQREGQFRVFLDSDDVSRLYINDKQVVEVKGLGATGRMKTGKVNLHPGDNKLRLEYVEYTGREGLILGVKGPGFAKNTFLTEEKSKSVSRPRVPPHMIVPDGQKAVHFRNFIMGTSSRSFAVGYPGGTNLVFDQELCGLAMLWEGEFYQRCSSLARKRYCKIASDRSPALHFAKWAFLSRPDHGFQTDGDGSVFVPHLPIS